MNIKYISFAIMVTLASQMSFAQDTAEKPSRPGYDTVIDEVVVTARKRNESLSDAPVSVKAFTSEEIRSAGIESPQINEVLRDIRTFRS